MSNEDFQGHAIAFHDGEILLGKYSSKRSLKDVFALEPRYKEKVAFPEDDIEKLYAAGEKVYSLITRMLENGEISMPKLPKHTVERIFEEAGAEELEEDVYEEINEDFKRTAEEAVKSARMKGKKTVSASDLDLVVPRPSEEK